MGHGDAWQIWPGTPPDYWRRQIRAALSTRAVPSKLLYLSHRAAQNWVDLCGAFDLRLQAGQLLRRALPELVTEIATRAKTLSILSLGPGTGDDDALLLQELCTQQVIEKPIAYIAYDVSYPLLQATVARIRERFTGTGLHFEALVHLSVINADFDDLVQYRDTVLSGSTPRLILLLGGTLGNFTEDNLITAVADIMRPGDQLLLGVDCYHSELSDEQLQRRYSDLDIGRRFLAEPLIDFVVSNWRWGTKLEMELTANIETSVRPFRSSVPDAKTVIHKVTMQDQEYRLSLSHKYSIDKLRLYLQNRFVIEREWSTSQIRDDFKYSELTDYTLILLSRPMSEVPSQVRENRRALLKEVDDAWFRITREAAKELRPLYDRMKSEINICADDEVLRTAREKLAGNNLKRAPELALQGVAELMGVLE
ncbi:MAG TPA: L-histidine N(alpha)-methyltransferase [Thermoanaerobaculia bacterium]|nr:L-histidine N(alpha)-methyltransferase [Thermoanaerobaculia bacterium]